VATGAIPPNLFALADRLPHACIVWQSPVQESTMADDREDRIRKRAHAIWEKEGQSHGSAQRHWEQATADIDAEDSAVSSRPGKKASAGAGQKPSSSDTMQLGAGAAIAEHSKDAKAPAAKKAAARKPAAAPKKPAKKT
jgi:hypothetical protein